MMPISNSIKKLYPIIFLLFTVACVSHRTVSNRFIDESLTTPMDKLLILSVGRERVDSRLFENMIVSSLRQLGSDAQSATMILGVDTLPDKERVSEIAIEVGVNAILVTRLKSVDIETKVIRRPTVTTMDRGGIFLDGYHPTNFWESKEPDEISKNATVVIASVLYRINDGKLVWSMEGTIFKRESVGVILQENAKAIVNQLVKDKVIHREGEGEGEGVKI